MIEQTILLLAQPQKSQRALQLQKRRAVSIQAQLFFPDKLAQLVEFLDGLGAQSGSPELRGVFRSKCQKLLGVRRGHLRRTQCRKLFSIQVESAFRIGGPPNFFQPRHHPQRPWPLPVNAGQRYAKGIVCRSDFGRSHQSVQAEREDETNDSQPNQNLK